MSVACSHAAANMSPAPGEYFGGDGLDTLLRLRVSNTNMIRYDVWTVSIGSKSVSHKAYALATAVGSSGLYNVEVIDGNVRCGTLALKQMGTQRVLITVRSHTVALTRGKPTDTVTWLQLLNRTASENASVHARPIIAVRFPGIPECNKK